MPDPIPIVNQKNLTNLTVKDVFAGLGLLQWWDTSRITQAWGQNGEKGTDYGLSGMGKPVGSITTGQVVYVGNGGYPGSSIGQIVQVRTPDGALLHYQHLKESSVFVGQAIQVGDVIGLGGGCPVGAYYADASRADCKRYDDFSSGQHIEVRFSPNYNPKKGVWGQNWQDPAGIFNIIAGHSATAPTNSPFSSPFLDGSNSSSGTAGLDFRSLGVKIGIFVLALAFIGGGLYIVFQSQNKEAIA